MKRASSAFARRTLARGLGTGVVLLLAGCAAVPVSPTAPETPAPPKIIAEEPPKPLPPPPPVAPPPLPAKAPPPRTVTVVVELSTEGCEVTEVERRPPDWLNEGLSELVETYDIRDPGLVRPQISMARRIEAWIVDGRSANLEDLLGWKPNMWKLLDRKPDFRSRTLSWGLVYHLMSTPDGRALLRRVLKESQSGKSPSALLVQYHPGGIEALQKAFNETFRRGPPLPFRVD